MEDELPWVDKVMAPERQDGNYERLTAALLGSGLKYFDSIAYMEAVSYTHLVDNIMTTNGLSSDVIHPGDSLILVKEITRQ